jgi:hypothetical protein
MAKDNRSIGAWELMQQLQADPEWVAQDAVRSVKHETKVRIQAAAVKPEQDPILNELAEVGYASDSVWDLVNTNESYAAAIPILVKFLPLVRHPVLREGLARTLTVPEARGMAGEVLLAELRKEADSELRWVFANALTVAADRADAVAIKAMLDDPAYEDVGERLGKALKNLGSIKG